MALAESLEKSQRHLGSEPRPTVMTRWLEGRQPPLEPTSVVMDADAIEALPVETPTLVLEHLAAGESPYTAVVSLVRDAAAVAEGRLPDAEALTRRIKELED